MSEDEIMKLEAGRELDALVARQIMGWSKWNIISDTGNFPGWFTKIELGQLGKGWYMADDNWSPSTDIAAAWQVVERMRKLGRETQHYYNERRGPWWSFWKPFGIEASATAETDALAICRAALLAVMDNRP